jgi:low affinity Fe/Cu permease
LPSILAHLIFNQGFSSSCRIADLRMQKRLVRHGLTRLGELAAHPAAFGVIAIYAVAWLLFSPRTFGWTAIASLATWFMTLLITRTEHRDTEAIQAKLDELLRTHGEARDELTAIDEKDVEEITAHRAKEREDVIR